jgi:hypothetical protein
MPSIPVGDVLRSFVKGGFFRKLLDLVKGTKIKRGDWEIQLDQEQGINDSTLNKPHKPGPDITPRGRTQ